MVAKGNRIRGLMLVLLRVSEGMHACESAYIAGRLEYMVPCDIAWGVAAACIVLCVQPLAVYA